MQILLANPHGFCAGVKRAIILLENVLKIYGPPVYVYHEIVHNNFVINTFIKQGVVFINNISELPDNAVLVFSAHGVSKLIRQQAITRKSILFDATCPLVSKVHARISRASSRGYEFILIGHAGHPEVEGTIGQYTNSNRRVYIIKCLEDVFKLKVINPAKLYFSTQTTMSVNETTEIVNALRSRYPKIIGPTKNDICYATINRQKALYKLARKVDVVLVIGSKNSSNANRLVELVKHMGKIAFLIEDAMDIKTSWIKKICSIGVTASASTPDVLVKNVISKLEDLSGNKVISIPGNEENIIFKIPKELRIKSFNI